MQVKHPDGSVSEARGLGHYPGIAGFDDAEAVLKVASLVWDPIGLSWIKMTQPGGVGGGGDASAANQVLELAQLTAINAKLPAALVGGRIDVNVGNTPDENVTDRDARILGRVKIWDGTDVVLVSAAGAMSVDTNLLQALTDAQLRASAVPISLADLDARILGRTKIHDGTDVALVSAAGELSVVEANIDVALSTRLKPADTLTAVATVTNLSQLGGQAVTMGTGVRTAGTQRVTIATDDVVPVTNANLDVALSTRLKPADTLAAVTSLTQMNGQAIAMGTGVRSAGTQRVTVATDDLVPVSGPVTSAQLYETDHDVANTLKNVQIAGHASPIDLPPTAVSANADRARVWVDRFGSPVFRRRKIRESYTAVFRLAEAAARLDQTFTHVANTNKQWATIHHVGASTKELRLMYVICNITAFGTATSQGILELRELTVTTPPATGNPVITPRARRIGTGAAEATCLYLPTTQGSEAAVNGPLKSLSFDSGIVGAASAVNPFVGFDRNFVLYNAKDEDEEMMPPTAPLGAYGGWAVMLRTVGVPVVRMTVEIGFTEEIP